MFSKAAFKLVVDGIVVFHGRFLWFTLQYARLLSLNQPYAAILLVQNDNGKILYQQTWGAPYCTD